uniref:ABC-2 type transporter domain-containing protein n=1 Tax=Lactuca sativa TaxID=4236 RepID=A0A9R1XUF2_LACSA|nr:hypothetical protein LSAT_V11C100011110 [Lactuca sativa]
MALHSLVLNPEDTTTTTTITKPIEELSTMVKPDQALYLITLKAHRFTMVLLPHLWTIFLQLDFPCLLQSNRLTFFLILLMEGIAPDSMHDYEQGENTNDEKKSIRQQLISCYETRLKTDVCDLDVGNYNPGKETLPRNCVESEQWCTSWWHQFKVLVLRGLRERRFEAFNKLRIFQVISVAMLAGLLW